MMILSEIKSIKSQANILKVISSFIEIRREGANYFGSCPFHNEKSRSFSVSVSKNIFKCFGCGKSGDAIDFVMLKKGFALSEAARYVADIENITPDIDYTSAPIEVPETSYIDHSEWCKAMNILGRSNNFIKWIDSKFPAPSLSHYISGSKWWKGSVIFWYVDIEGRVRSGKIMQYDPVTGKRIKEPKPLITWVHRAAGIKDFNLSICLFGEHLLPLFPSKKVCIVESEKSAIVASIADPSRLWLASGSLTNLTYERCKVLEGRDVTLYPDVGAEERWIEKCNQLHEIIPGKWRVKTIRSDIKGYDLCDWIVDNLVKKV